MEESRKNLLPSMLGRYRVVKRLGAGGMAEVFLARSPGAEGIEKLLVVKRVLPSFAENRKFIDMFVHEAEIAMRLNHPNIVQVYAFEEHDGQFLLAMEHVDGIDVSKLNTVLYERRSRLPIGLAAFLAMEIAKGLAYAHSRKDSAMAGSDRDAGSSLDIVHRDVSPQNVLLTFEGGVKLADFGIAKMRQGTEETGAIKGKIAYMSPEQAQGDEVDQRTDIYSLGILFAELLMGRKMYPGLQGLELLTKVKRGEVTLPGSVDRGIPAELNELVRRATHPDRSKRLDNARMFAQELAHFLHRQPAVFDATALEQYLIDLFPARTVPEGALELGTITSSVAELNSGDDLPTQIRERAQVMSISLRVQGADVSLSAAAMKVLEEIAYKAGAAMMRADELGRHVRFLIGVDRASEQDPIHCIRLAFELRDALGGMAEDLSAPVTAGFGVSRGTLLTVREPQGRILSYQADGEVLNIADTLSLKAGSQDILVAGDVYHLTRRFFAYDKAKQIQVHKTDHKRSLVDIQPYLVRGWLSSQRVIAETRERIAGVGLLGRKRELSYLSEAAREARFRAQKDPSAGPVMRFVTGPLGIGKTALVAHALGSLEEHTTVVHVDGATGIPDAPYAALGEVINTALSQVLPSSVHFRSQGLSAKKEFLERATHVLGSKARSALNTLAPLILASDSEDASSAPHEAHRNSLGHRRSPESSNELRHPSELRRAFAELIRVLASKLRPLVLFIDSLHFTDAASRQLILDLRHEPALPVFIVLSGRLTPSLAQLPSFLPTLTLARLDQDASHALIRACWGGAKVDQEVMTSVSSLAAGTPFFVTELVDALNARGAVAIVADNGKRRVQFSGSAMTSMPKTLRGLLVSRLAQLPDMQRLALRWLAVAGPGFHERELSRMAGSDLGAAFEVLMQLKWVRRGERRALCFVHAVSRQVAYESCEEQDRKAMHERVARFLEQGAADDKALQLAKHLERAGNAEKAGAAFMQAAHIARRTYANALALRLYDRAQRLLPASHRAVIDICEGRAQIFRGLGQRENEYRELEAMLARAEGCGLEDMVAKALNRLARHALDGHALDGIDMLLSRAKQQARASGVLGAEVEALKLEAKLAMRKGHLGEGLSCAREALERVALDETLLAARASVLLVQAELLSRTNETQAALSSVIEASVIFRRLDIKRNEAQALHLLGTLLSAGGEHEDALAVVQESVLIDQDIGDSFHIPRKMRTLASLHTKLGRSELAHAYQQASVYPLEMKKIPVRSQSISN